MKQSLGRDVERKIIDSILPEGASFRIRVYGQENRWRIVRRLPGRLFWPAENINVMLDKSSGLSSEIVTGYYWHVPWRDDETGETGETYFKDVYPNKVHIRRA